MHTSKTAFMATAVIIGIAGWITGIVMGFLGGDPSFWRTLLYWLCFTPAVAILAGMSQIMRNQEILYEKLEKRN